MNHYMGCPDPTGSQRGNNGACFFFICRVKSWADAFGDDLYYVVTKYSGSLLLQKVSEIY